MSDNCSAGSHRAIITASGHGGDTIDELRLSDRSHRRWSLASIHGAALHIDRGLHIVTASHIGQQFVEQIARDFSDDLFKPVGRRWQRCHSRRRSIPQVMMRIYDRQVWLEDLFDIGRSGHDQALNG